MVKPEEVKEIRDVEVTATQTKFQIVVPVRLSKIVLSFDMKDAQALRRELEEWIDVGTVIRATRQQLAKV